MLLHAYELEQFGSVILFLAIRIVTLATAQTPCSGQVTRNHLTFCQTAQHIRHQNFRGFTPRCNACVHDSRLADGFLSRHTNPRLGSEGKRFCVYRPEYLRAEKENIRILSGTGFTDIFITSLICFRADCVVFVSTIM